MTGAKMPHDLPHSADSDMLSSMPSILIRDVPESTRAEIAARAASRGQSMQEYLKARLVELAAKPDADTALARIREHRLALRRRLTVEEIVALKDDEERP